MAEWYMASCQLSVSSIFCRSILAFSAVNLDLRVFTSDPTSRGFSPFDPSGSVMIEGNSGAHHCRAFPSPDEFAVLAAITALLGRRRVEAEEMRGGEERDFSEIEMEAIRD
ncbi:hypothetical protein J5N97_030130 [Dioscorea zingiberensis]|uniref:Uncharacterized protein n=1 Tax=Dioscorea zingiberensis TaxID=325984 RepID=A0A9D5BWJ2_9LILI|nr:hypothetical protein J5N97_030130 [Dioscorea zingiberensis]